MVRPALVALVTALLAACDGRSRVLLDINTVPATTRRLLLTLNVDGQALTLDPFRLAPPLTRSQFNAELRLGAPVQRGFTLGVRAYEYEDQFRDECLIGLGQSGPQEGHWEGTRRVSLDLRPAWRDLTHPCTRDALQIVNVSTASGSQELRADGRDILNVQVLGLQTEGAARLFAFGQELSQEEPRAVAQTLSAPICPSLCEGGVLALEVEDVDGARTQAPAAALRIGPRSSFSPERPSAQPGMRVMAVGSDEQGGALIATGGDGGAQVLRPLQDEQNLALLKPYALAPPGAAVTALAFLPGDASSPGARLLVARSDGSLQLHPVPGASLGPPPLLALSAGYQAAAAIQHLLVTDLDGDGRTDVIAVTAPQGAAALAQVLLFKAPLGMGQVPSSVLVPGPVALLGAAPGDRPTMQRAMLFTVAAGSAVLIPTPVAIGDSLQPRPEGRLFALGLVPTSLVLADLDQDGQSDLVLVGQQDKSDRLVVVRRQAEALTPLLNEPLSPSGAHRERVLAVCDPDPDPLKPRPAPREVVLLSNEPGQPPRLSTYLGYHPGGLRTLRLLATPLSLPAVPSLAPSAVSGVGCARLRQGQPRSFFLASPGQIQVLAPDATQREPAAPTSDGCQDPCLDACGQPGRCYDGRCHAPLTCR